MSRRGWVLFAVMSVIWGIPYLLIRVAVRELSPGVIVFGRTAPAALLLLPIALRQDALRPLRARFPYVALFAIVEMAIPWFLLSRAEQHLSSSVTGLLVATVPLIGALLARITSHGEHFGVRRLCGLVLGLSGVAVLVGVDVKGIDLASVGMVIVVAVCYAIGPFIVVKRLSDLPSLGVINAAVALTALGYAPYALTHLPAHVSLEAIGAVAGLAVVCTALAFVLFFALIQEVGPTRSTVITYVNPAVAVLLGVTILGEPFTGGIAIGFPMILVGSMLATSSGERRSEPEAVGTPS
ncbi:MAG TPA: DMT family transporter [Acidimicrobiales bacterium]|nr:DMT family transporter [Acidimicrobiales bacterium]